MKITKIQLIEKANDYVQLFKQANEQRKRWLNNKETFAKNDFNDLDKWANNRIETYHNMELRIEKRVDYLLKSAFTR